MPRITPTERKRMHLYLDECIDKMNSPKNSKKEHWSGMRKEILQKMVAVEILELEVAIMTRNNLDILDECKDIVNLVMMIMDNLLVEGEPVEPVPPKVRLL